MRKVRVKCNNDRHRGLPFGLSNAIKDLTAQISPLQLGYASKTTTSYSAALIGAATPTPPIAASAGGHPASHRSFPTPDSFYESLADGEKTYYLVWAGRRLEYLIAILRLWKP